MNIEELTIKQIKEIQSIFPSLPTQTTHPLLNKNVIVRTVSLNNCVGNFSVPRFVAAR